MALIQQNLEKIEIISIHPTAARTATGSTTGVDVRQYDGELRLVLDSAAGSGTNPTLDIVVEHSDTLGSGYTAISGSAVVTSASFTQVTGTASQQMLLINKDACRRFIRITYTIGGTNPSFTFSVNAGGARKYG